MKKGPQATQQEAEQKLKQLGFTDNDIQEMRMISQSTASVVDAKIQEKEVELARAKTIGNTDIVKQREHELKVLENQKTNLNSSTAFAVLQSGAAVNNIARIRMAPLNENYGYTDNNPKPGTESFINRHLPELHAAHVKAQLTEDRSHFTNQWRTLLEPHTGYFEQRNRDLVASTLTALETHRTVLECVGVDLNDSKVQENLNAISKRWKKDMSEAEKKTKEMGIIDREIPNFTENTRTNDIIRDYKPPVSTLNLSGVGNSNLARAAPRGEHPKPEEFAAAMAERNKAIERKRSGENVLPPTVPSAGDTGAQAKAPSADALLSRLTQLTQERSAQPAVIEREVSHQNPLFGSPQLSSYIDRNKPVKPQEEPGVPKQDSAHSLKK